MAAHDWEAGNNVQLSWQASGVLGSDFTIIGNISEGDLERGSSREASKAVIRGDTVDSYFINPVMSRPPWTFVVGIDDDDTQYQALMTAYRTGTTHGWMQRGINAEGNPSGAYEIVSGKLVNCKVTSPHEVGHVKLAMEIRPSGAWILDGIEIS